MISAYQKSFFCFSFDLQTIQRENSTTKTQSNGIYSQRADTYKIINTNQITELVIHLNYPRNYTGYQITSEILILSRFRDN